MSATALAPPASPKRSRLRWWREVAFVLAFYGVYSFVRNQFGSAAVDAGEALANAKLVIAVERALGLYHEPAVQDWALQYPLLVRFWNVFYGTFHFVVTAFALIWTYRRFPERYARWRTVLACTTGVALVGFATFPLMPPRLLPASFGFVDTLEHLGGAWSFDSEAIKSVSNQYAAMPSLHFGWALWCSMVLGPVVRRSWARLLSALYPWLTLVAIVVTANHYWLDAVGGAVALGAGVALGGLLTGRAERPRPAPLPATT